ncbi:MAG: 3-oxoacyl-[acyl-carrier-protein] reductase [Planctomycetes bacterium]|nr:3-oxoacyl-[acyl-carrier-protein] reductase [Planctomycetota bacterium]
MALLTDKKALITGASRGIGRAIALAFAKEGASLALFATSNDKLADTAARCAEAGCKTVHTFGLDVRNSADVDGAVKKASEVLGGLDIVVNNAGVTKDNLLMRLSDDDYNAVLDTNLKGAFNVTRAATRSLMKSKAGRLINIASIVGITGNAGQANYAASKGGLIAFTKSVAKELSGRGVTANVIAPGFIETDMTSGLDPKVKEAALKEILLGRMGKPEDIAAAAVFLAGDAASYVTAQVLVVDGGLTA